jgi:ABC-type branched-subunit amino acid transport system substrate-binding protein
MHGHEPGYHAGGGYGAGQVLEAAVKKAGSTDRDKVREALSRSTVTAFGATVDATGKQIGVRLLGAVVSGELTSSCWLRLRPPWWPIRSRISALKD